MSHHKNHKNESQDARRHEQLNATHPNEKSRKDFNKSSQNQNKIVSSQPNKQRHSRGN